MSDDTTRLGLPLLQPAQAQKHVTVNEALMRLDGLVNLVLESADVTAPPPAPPEGSCWAVPEGAVDGWAGQAGTVAIAANGGWIFVRPGPGQRAFLRDQGVAAVHDGTGWAAGALTLGASGAGLSAGIAEAEIEIGTGAEIRSDLWIPAGVMVIGCTARVTEALGGTATSWMLGTEGAADRFGQGLGVAQGSWARGILSAPMTYWEAAPLILTAEGGAFGGGRVRLAAHWLELRLPR